MEMHWPGKPYRYAVARLIEEHKPQTILDVAAGDGWLGDAFGKNMEIDAIDWRKTALRGYRKTFNADLNQGFPNLGSRYDAVVCCEALAYLSNPGLLFSGAFEALHDGGLLIITTPNTWYPESRLAFFLRGFHMGFPPLVGKMRWGEHMHLIPWPLPQLHCFLSLHGFRDIQLHEVPERKPKRVLEWCVGAPAWLYCRFKARSSSEEEERLFWRMAGRRQALFGRRLVVSGVKSGKKDAAALSDAR